MSLFFSIRHCFPVITAVIKVMSPLVPVAGVSVDCTVFETSCVSTVCGWISSGKWAEEDLWLSWIFYHSVGLFFLTVPYRIKNKTTISNCSSLTCLSLWVSCLRKHRLASCLQVSAGARLQFCDTWTWTFSFFWFFSLTQTVTVYLNIL